jgi:cytochrome c oxidase subunit 1
MAAWFLCLAQLPFIINFFWTLWRGKKTPENPWHATTVEWDTPTPPPHGNFSRPVQIHRGPYEYSVPGHSADFTMQTQPEKGAKH